MMDLELMKQLSETAGVSGDEGRVRRLIRQAIADYVDEQRVDSLGNLIAVKRGSGEMDLRVMVAAHMDEVGFMITHADSSGFLHFRKVGGFDDRILPSKVLTIGEDGARGVIGVKPIHLLEGKDRRQVVKVKNMTIDVGAAGKGEAEKVAKTGTYATFATEFRELGETVRGKAFDDRAGCAMLIELLKEDYPFEFHAAFTVQEEIGLRGARVAAYAIDPDVAFALEGTIADDLPKEKDVSSTTELGKGPAITIMDRSVIVDRRLMQLLIETADENDIPYQFKQPGLGGTDAGAIHLSREGIPSAVVAVPCRYIHSPAAIMRHSDFDHAVDLMHRTLLNLDREDWRVRD